MCTAVGLGLYYADFIGLPGGPGLTPSRALVVGLGVTGRAVGRALVARGATVTAVEDRPSGAHRTFADEVGIGLVEAPDAAALPAPPGRRGGAPAQPGRARPSPRVRRRRHGRRARALRVRPGRRVGRPAGRRRHRHQRQDHRHPPGRRHAPPGRARRGRGGQRRDPPRRGHRRPGGRGVRGRGQLVPAGAHRPLGAGGGRLAQLRPRPPRRARRPRGLRGGQGQDLGRPGPRGRRGGQRRRPGGRRPPSVGPGAAPSGSGATRRPRSATAGWWSTNDVCWRWTTSAGPCATTRPTRWPPPSWSEPLGVGDDAVAAALTAFDGLPHRVQLVGEAAGVAWYDDSKATTPARHRCRGRRASSPWCSSPAAATRASTWATCWAPGLGPGGGRHRRGRPGRGRRRRRPGPGRHGPLDGRGRRRSRRRSPGPATPSCCPPAAPPSTGTRPTASGATTSPDSSASTSTGRPRAHEPSNRHPGPGRSRRRTHPAGAERTRPGRHDPGASRGRHPSAGRGPKRPPGDRSSTFVGLLAVVTALVLIGLVMVMSAASVSDLRTSGSAWDSFTRQAIFAVVGFAGMFAVMRQHYGLWRRLATPFLIVSFVLLALVLVPGVGVGANGATRWLGAGSLRIQPSELAKLAMVVWSARWLAMDRNHDVVREDPRVLRPVLFALGGARRAAPAAAQPGHPDHHGRGRGRGDLRLGGLAGPAHRLGGSGVRGRGASRRLSADYRRARVLAFLHPWADPANTGYQTIQSLVGIAGGRPHRRRPRRQSGQVGLPALRPHRLHLRHHRRGARPDRGGHRPRPARRAGLLRRPGRPPGPRHLRHAPRRRDHRLVRPAGPGQRRRRGGPAADHRRAAARSSRTAARRSWSTCWPWVSC